MEIQVKIDGQLKTFKQDKVTFQTIRKCLEWKKHIDETQRKLYKVLNTPITDDLDDEEVEEINEYTAEINGYSDLEVTLDLVMSFFDGQFTLDEFLKGCYFKNVGEFYSIAQEIYELAILQKNDVEVKGQKKPLNGKKKR